MTTAYADIGPAPPSLYFRFSSDVSSNPIAEGTLLLCEDAECHESRAFGIPRRTFGAPQIFQCGDDYCATAFGIDENAPYYRIVVKFADKTRESNVFKKLAYSAKYAVEVREDDLYVRDVSSWRDFLNPLQVFLYAPALVLTIVAESLAAALYSRWTHIPINVPWVAFANLVSVQVVWFVIPVFTLSFGWAFLSAEAFAVAFEAVYLFIANRKTGLSLRRAGIISVLLNASSIAAGLAAIAAVWGLLAAVNLVFSSL